MPIGPVRASRTGVALRDSGTTASTRLRAQQSGDGHRDGAPRDGVQVREVAFVDLLAPAWTVELDHLHVQRVVKVGDWRIVEGQVPVLADTETTQVERMCDQERCVPVALRRRFSGPVEAVSRLGARRFHDPFTDPPLEASLVVRTHSHVLVHVEDDGVGPGDVGGLVDQDPHELELRVARCEHGVGHAPRGNCVAQNRGGLVCGRPRQRGKVFVDVNRRAVKPQPAGLRHVASMPGPPRSNCRTCPVLTAARSLFPVLDSWRRAWNEVRRYLALTPVVETPQLGPSVSVKLETLQPTGSFKVRGGLAAVAATLAEEPGRAVVASSAGNHGLGLAYAATRLGAEVTVVVPTGASAAKVSSLRQFGVRLVLHGEGYREAETYALDLAASEGMHYVSPYNDPDVIAGQATVARELRDQVPDLGTVVVPCGGGGLLSGVILALGDTGVRIVGVESEASPSMSAAVAAGAIVPIHVEPTVADGLAGNLEPGAVTVGIVVSHHVEVLTVSEADIRSAMAFSAHKMGLVLEGAGAVGVAALRAGTVTPDPAGKRTVVLLTGRNVAPKLLSEVLHS